MIPKESSIKSILSAIKTAKYVSCDTETNSLTDKTLVAFSFALYDGQNVTSYFIPVAMKYIPNISENIYRQILQGLSKKEGIVFHNFSFDGVVLKDYNFIKPHDTLVISNLLDENIRHGLKGLTKRYLHHQMTELKEIVGSGKKQIPVSEADERLIPYASEDAEYTLKLFLYLYPKLLRNEKLNTNIYEKIERPLLNVVKSMHLAGITIDALSVLNIENLCARKVKKALERLEYLMPNVNYNSTKQLREFFINKEMMPIIKETKKGSPAVDKEVLTKYAETSAAAKLLLEYRKYNKILSTVIPALTPKLVDVATYRGKIYPSFNQSGTVSGRFSSSKPNFQNIPKDKDMDFRDCIIAEEGNVLIGYDYSQIELRILAHVTQDFNLMKAYKENLDIHQLTADACGISRDKAKTVNFGIVYGMRNKTLGKRIGVTPQEAQQYIDKYMETYNRIKPYWEHAEQQLRLSGYVETVCGRKRHRTQEFSVKDKFDQSREIGSAINSTIQGSGGDILKMAMVDMYPKLKLLGATIIACIHDELIISCPKSKEQQGEKIVKESMLNAASILSVPMLIDGGIGQTWRDIHE